MRLLGFKVCSDTEGSLQGLQFILSENDYTEPIEDFDAETLVLDPIGVMEGNCSQMKLSSALKTIKAQNHEGEIIDGLKVNNANGQSLEFGKEMKPGVLGEDKQKWQFTLSAPVIGIYGNHSDRGIEKLGFITLDE
jgi:hypothetical protein